MIVKRAQMESGDHAFIAVRVRRDGSPHVDVNDLVRDYESGMSFAAIARSRKMTMNQVRDSLRKIGVGLDAWQRHTARLAVKAEAYKETRHKVRLECAKRWREADPERLKRSEDEQNKKRYRIRQRDYEAMLALQDGRCLICGNTKLEKGRPLAVDHCHKTGEIRGLLCIHCNVGLGMFRDDPDLLANAIAYLTAFLKKRKLVAVG